MEGYDLYSFFLCLIVFILLAGLSALMLTEICKLTIKTIRHGLEDDSIKEEYSKTQEIKRKNKGFDFIVSLFLCLILCVVFLFSLFVNCKGQSYSDTLPTMRVVSSSSMSKKHEKNLYLVNNNLNDQMQVYDLIFTYKAPAEDQLKLYDIVVYETDGMFVIHRIIGIEEPNSSHPTERWFLLQGDANSVSDRFPVKYEQIRGVYRGERVPFIGSFILFMQSPAGWLCVLLVVASMIITPILEKKFAKERHARYLIICGQQEIVVTGPIPEQTQEEVIEKVNAFAHLKGKRNDRTFVERLDSSTDTVKGWYESVSDTLSRIADAKVIESKKQRTYKTGNTPVARLNFRGKTLNAYLGLNPEEYKDSKYIYTDMSEVKAHQNYPMRLKLSSDRQVRWTNQLIMDLCAKHGIALLEKPQEITVVSENPFAHLKGKRNDQTFDQKLEKLPIATARYNQVIDFLNGIDGIRLIDGKKTKTYRQGNRPVVRFAVRGKTLNAYLGLNPEEYKDSKYIYTDVSAVKKYANYPMRLKLSSDRQVRWAIELIKDLCAQNQSAKGVK